MNDKETCQVASIVLNTFTRDSRVEKEAESLSLAGYAVSVFALASKSLPKSETKNGYCVRRVEVWTKVLGKSFLAQAIKLVEFTIKVAWMIRKCGFIHCHDYHPLPAVFLSRTLFRSQASVIYDAHEFETCKNGASLLMRKIISIIEKLSRMFINQVITVSPLIAKEYQEIFDPLPVEVILNCPRLSKLRRTNLLASKLGIASDKTIILYQGAFMPGRGIEQMMEAFMVNSSSYALVLMGYASISQEGKDLENKIRDLDDDVQNSIYFMPSVPSNELLQYTASADIGFCIIEDLCLSYRLCLPNKFFEFAMAGLPIVVSDLPELRRLVLQYDCGVVCPDLSPLGIHASIEELLGKDLVRIQANSRKMAEDHCWEQQEKKLVDLYGRLIPTATARLD